MNIQPHSIQFIAGDDMLVLDFFAKFSRFECALKRAELLGSPFATRYWRIPTCGRK